MEGAIERNGEVFGELVRNQFVSELAGATAAERTFCEERRSCHSDNP